MFTISILLIIFSFLFHYIILGQATSPQTGGSSGSLKSMKEKPGKDDKEVQETSGLKTAGPEGEITAGMHLLCTLSVLLNVSRLLRLFWCN